MSDLRGFERSLPIALLRAREATMRLFKPHVDAAGLTLEQWRVIRALAEGGQLDARQLADQCAVLPPSLSRILTALEGREMLIRARDPSDGRRTVIHLTYVGAALFQRIAPYSEQAYQRLESEFGQEKLNELLENLVELRAAAEKLANDQT